MNICEMTRRKIIMRKRATRIAACVLAGVMAMQMTGCGNKKVDYTLDGESGSASGYSDDGSNDAGGSLAKSLGIPEKCDETFDVGNSGLSEISCSGSIDIPDTDSMKRVYYSTMKLDAAQIQSIVEGLLDKSQGIYIRKDGVQTKDELKSMIESTEKFKKEAQGQGDDSSDAWYDTQIETYKKQMADAPDSLPLLENYDDPYSSYTGKYGDKEYTVSISQYGGEDDNTDAGVYISFYKSESEENKLLDGVSGATYTYVTGISNATDIDLTNVTNESKLTENDAVSQAMNFLSKMGIDGMESTKTEPLARIWSDDNGEVKQTKVSGYSVTLSRSIYGAKEREGELYNVDNLQTQNGYMFEPGDSVTLNIDDDGVVDMFAQLYTDPSSLQAEDVELMSWNDMIAKANEGIATYYEKYQTRYGKVQFNNVALRYMATADDDGKLCYIPAWIFTQSEELRGQDTVGEISQIICINAIDGSCIDIVDNAKKMKLWETY